MKVISMFDGIAGARQALKNLGVDCEYHAYEIDKYAISVAQANHPDIIQRGDVFGAGFFGFDNVDLLVAGSPCQGFSFAGKQLNFNDPRSKLFFEFIRVLREVKPKYFLLENVKMKKEYQDIISEAVGVEPIEINSALVTAQNRKRLYWTNIPDVKQPEDKHVYLKDVLGIQGVIGRVVGRRLNEKGKRDDYNLNIKPIQRFEARQDSKSGTLTTVQKDNLVYRDKSKTVRSSGRGSYDRHEWDSVDKNHLRKLTPLECERLQGYPDNYSDGVSNTQRYKALGNSFTVPVIEHILKGVL